MEVISNLHQIRKGINETEIEFSSRLNTAAYSCGNFVNDGDKMKLFVYKLLTQMRTVVARYGEDQPRASSTFEILVTYARDEGK